MSVERQIDYEALAQDAMRGVVRTILDPLFPFGETARVLHAHLSALCGRAHQCETIGVAAQVIQDMTA